MRMTRIGRAVLTAALLVPGGAWASQPETGGDPIPEQVRRLETSTTKADRLAVIDWFLRHGTEPGANRAAPALERCMKDADPEVRVKAVEARGNLAMQQRVPCPVAVVEALLDGNPEVREMAVNWSGVLPKQLPASVPVLLRVARSDDAGLRSHVLFLLARAAPKDERVLGVLREATRDRDATVRHSAHAALFHATGKLEDIVPYCLLLPQEIQAEPLPRTEAEKKERAEKKYLWIGAVTFLYEQGEKRPDEMAKFLLGALKDGSPSLRRATASYIDHLANGHLLGGAALESSVRERLGEMNVEAALRELSAHDPDAGVRKTAEEAVQHWSGGQEKKR